ncbi:MAG: hypothetical protein NT051_04110, partial [Candidatus Micrarchaeota archaeon]|nr:hypothetical protein [Candidatus Micrarchaeota archaeon]
MQKTELPKSKLSPTPIKTMNVWKNDVFYRSFLENGRKPGHSLPLWIYPKLIANGQIELARANFPEIRYSSVAKREGEIFEWMLIFLRQKLESSNALAEKIGESRRASYQLKDEIARRAGRINGFYHDLIKEISQLRTQDRYEIKTG